MSRLEPVLRIDAAPQPDGYVIRLEGELDLAGCPDLESVLADAERSQVDRIVVDLDRLSFIDVCGLQTLNAAWRRSWNNGNRLRLARAGGHVAFMFRLTMLDVTLPFTEPVGRKASRVVRRERASS
ncbi:MAG: anti-sigma-factor antagonist [Solirubrobacterales bacterium]|jgi:anti-anti-sigma factor|nr:anti-sigma-factor antagonist [Solirubrobacterales bacterium]